jgi:nucleoid DNA-binding protein
MTMTKRELVIRVANKLGMTQSDAAKIIEGTFDVLSKTLAEGKRWELRDFGVFEVKTQGVAHGPKPAHRRPGTRPRTARRNISARQEDERTHRNVEARRAYRGTRYVAAGPDPANGRTNIGRESRIPPADDVAGAVSVAAMGSWNESQRPR